VESQVVESAQLAGGELLVERRGPIISIVFNRPHVRNAMTWAMYAALVEVCNRVDADTSLRAMTLQGSGGAFIAGTDIAQFRAFESEQDVLNYVAYANRVMATLENVRIPTIAAIRGACTGGGAEIAAACDIRIASPSARYGFPIARTLGNALSGESLSRQVSLLGPAIVKHLIFTADLLNAQEIQKYGLAELVPTEEALMPCVENLVQRVAGNAPLTLRATKQALHRLAHSQGQVGDSDLVLRCYMSKDFKEGLEAFLAKREPRWRGE
jgi:enoyl-CoA hydratase